MNTCIILELQYLDEDKKIEEDPDIRSVLILTSLVMYDIYVNNIGYWYLNQKKMLG
jgi:hypothetical protein